MIRTPYYEIEQKLLKVKKYLNEVSLKFETMENNRITKNLKYCIKEIQEQIDTLRKVTTEEIEQQIKELKRRLKW